MQHQSINNNIFSWTWGPEEGLGELAVCVNEKPWNLYCGEPPCGQLNPVNPKVYDVLEQIYKEIIEMTGETEIFHIGGDEVNLECWAEHLQKGSTRLEKNYSDLHDLWGEYTLKALERLKRANNNSKIPHVIVWSSNLSKNPYATRYLDPADIFVQSWGSSQWPDSIDLIEAGYKLIVSHLDAWYLDCGLGKWRETGDVACEPYKSWQRVYEHRPWMQMRRQNIVGAEVCSWSEQLDEESLDARLWPRTAAFAERLWSDPVPTPGSIGIQEDVYTRLNTQRERLVRRGLKADALWPEYCRQNPGMCL